MGRENGGEGMSDELLRRIAPLAWQVLDEKMVRSALEEALRDAEEYLAKRDELIGVESPIIEKKAADVLSPIRDELDRLLRVERSHKELIGALIVNAERSGNLTIRYVVDRFRELGIIPKGGSRA